MEKIYTLEEIQKEKKKSYLLVRYFCSDCGTEIVSEYRRYKEKLKQDRPIYCKKCGLKNRDFEKTKKTCLEKYGVDNPAKIKEVKEKTKKTILEKYGVENISQVQTIKDDVQKKRKETMIERYGFIFNNSQKRKKTILEKYGVENTSQVEQIQNKTKETMIERYGVEHFTNPIKRKKTILEKYGVENTSQLDYVKEKVKETCLEKYGVASYSQTEEFIKKATSKYTYDNLNFDSSWELAFYIYAKDQNKEIIKEPCYFNYSFQGKEHKYFPDFLYENELIEIKGGQFFDEENNLINPYDRSLDALYKAKQNCMIENNVKILTNVDFAIEYVNKKFTKDYLSLFKNNVDFPYINGDFADKSDYGVIRYFHKSIYDANVKGRPSPIDGWKNKNIVKDVALNRLKYIGKCSPCDIVKGFSITTKAKKVSVFSPTLAKELIKRYGNELDTVFDPFSGFSGRMIGAFRNNKKYIGQDINLKHIEESKEISKYLNYCCTLKQQNIITDENKEFENTLLFTCPPYSDKESWNENEIIKQCDEWIDICMEKYKCSKYLFVVDNTEKYKQYVVDKIENKSHFGINYESIILIERKN